MEVFVGSYNAGYSYVCTPLKSDSYDPNEMMVSSILNKYKTVILQLTVKCDIAKTMFFEKINYIFHYFVLAVHVD